MKKEKPRRGVLGGAFNIYRMGWLLEGAAGTHAIAPMLWGDTPLADQQLGGLIMWMPAALVYAAWGALLGRRAWRAMGVAG